MGKQAAFSEKALNGGGHKISTDLKGLDSILRFAILLFILQGLGMTNVVIHSP